LKSEVRTGIVLLGIHKKTAQLSSEKPSCPGNLWIIEADEEKIDADMPGVERRLNRRMKKLHL
jgi:hypothetical protein